VSLNEKASLSWLQAMQTDLLCAAICTDAASYLERVTPYCDADFAVDRRDLSHQVPDFIVKSADAAEHLPANSLDLFDMRPLIVVSAPEYPKETGRAVEAIVEVYALKKRQDMAVGLADAFATACGKPIQASQLPVQIEKVRGQFVSRIRPLVVSFRQS
jgi:hypothetical protein